MASKTTSESWKLSNVFFWPKSIIRNSFYKKLLNSDLSLSVPHSILAWKFEKGNKDKKMKFEGD